MRIISLDVSRNSKNSENTKYGIIFNEDKIEEFIFVPSDYTIDEFIEVVLESFDKSDTKILLDKNGFGIALLDSLMYKGVSNESILTFSPNLYAQTLQLGYAKGVSKFLDFAINSQLYSYEKIEFKKLIEEVNNLEPRQKGNSFITLEQKDNNINKTRAICYMQYIGYKEGIK